MAEFNEAMKDPAKKAAYDKFIEAQRLSQEQPIGLGGFDYVGNAYMQGEMAGISPAQMNRWMYLNNPR
jgi:hypothetical protein